MIGYGYWGLIGIVMARLLSWAAMRNNRHNLFFAFIYNAAGMPIDASVLYPLDESCKLNGVD